jgi:hypothetical protein
MTSEGPDDETSACPGCGVVLPSYAGPTHAYMGASPACWRLYGRAATLSWGPRDDGLPLLRLVVDAYGAQHPGVCQIRSVQSVAVHLMGLCRILERDVRADARLMPVRDRPPRRTRLDLHWLDPPHPIGTLNIRGPIEATGGDEHAARVEAWARDVWAAWQPHHETVRGWVDRAAPRAPLSDPPGRWV